ncbi:hypothetical protein HZR02_15305 [Elizabethkingia anophelis]|nr:hypothetical protein [Elizabethkingia anophelis]MCT3660250.1 hypothetical protein [Elizabethkingia anophelis]MCT3667370.1 hypothetical protein [Elizabethkingia anophelis]MCT3853352.1 hypothetical protein [Elizabethkingia anophelis]MCT3864166.1 hypothetical protein [Elizabethkingia anophelis]
MKSKMINNLIGLGTILLGATMAKKAGVTFFENSTYSDFKITDRIVDSISVFESGGVARTVETAYNLKGETWGGAGYPNSKLWTIGNGMTVLYLEGGKRFITNYPAKGANGVRQGDTLSNLKVLMGYSSLSSVEFAKVLTQNFAEAAAYSDVAKDLDKLGVPFNVNYAEALMEMSYGSGSAFRTGTKYDKARGALFGYRWFLDSIKRDPSPYNFARSYFIFRMDYYRYGTVAGAWDRAKEGWMPRIFFASMVAKGGNVDPLSVKNGYYNKKSLLIRDIQREFGLVTTW